MNALWIGIVAGATGVAALVFSFFADRRSRNAIQRVKDLERAPRVVGPVLPTRSGQRIAFDELKGALTLLVNVPARGADPHRMARLETVRNRFGADVLDVVALPIGRAAQGDDETPRRAGAIPVLGRVERHPMADVLAADFTDVDAAYAKLLIDGRGHVVARFAPETDPRSIEVRRTVEAALTN